MIKALKQMADELCDFLWVNRWIHVVVALSIWLMYLFFSWAAHFETDYDRSKAIQQRLIEKGENKIQDKCIYREAMEGCLSKLPQGAQRLTASGNDWEEVAMVCKEYANEVSMRQSKNVKDECK